jgi:hypothetical protein
MCGGEDGHSILWFRSYRHARFTRLWKPQPPLFWSHSQTLRCRSPLPSCTTIQAVAIPLPELSFPERLLVGLAFRRHRHRCCRRVKAAVPSRRDPAFRTIFPERLLARHFSFRRHQTTRPFFWCRRRCATARDVPFWPAIRYNDKTPRRDGPRGVLCCCRRLFVVVLLCRCFDSLPPLVAGCLADWDPAALSSPFVAHHHSLYPCSLSRSS